MACSFCHFMSSISVGNIPQHAMKELTKQLSNVQENRRVHPSACRAAPVSLKSVHDGLPVLLFRCKVNPPRALR